MKTPIIPLAFALLLPLSAPAAAGDIPCNPEGTQVELNACAAEDYAEADAALNAAWRDLTRRLADQPLALQRLRAAQRAWLAFRDAEVASLLPVADGEDPRLAHGSMYPMLLNGILATLTRERTAQLHARLDELNAL